MASYRQRDGRWQARISMKGYPAEVKTFDTKGEAQRWALQVEASMSNKSYKESSVENGIRFSDILERYSRDVSPTKRGGFREQQTIGFVQRHRIAKYAMDKLSPSVLASYRDERLRTVSSGTIIRELSVLSSVINHARREWGVTTDNPCDQLRRPPSPPGRNRVLSDDEEVRLLNELEPIKRRNKLMKPLVELALATAMRRGELLSLRWDHIEFDRRTAFLPLTKNGASRIVPLSSKAIAVLHSLDQADTRVFPLNHAAVSAAFDKARKRANLSDVHFHDLRHTATSRMAEKLPNVIELASVTGHQTVQMLKRYYHPKAESLAQKLG